MLQERDMVSRRRGDGEILSTTVSGSLVTLSSSTIDIGSDTDSIL